MIRVVRLQAGRWKDYRRLRLEALKKASPAFGSSYEEEVKHPEATWRERISNCLFAMEGDTPVGLISLVFNDRLKTRHIANIYGFYVRPSSRGKGIGTALMTEALSLALENKDIRKVKLSVNPLFRQALSVYRKAGFKVTGKEHGEIKVGKRLYDLVSMELKLRRS